MKESPLIPKQQQVSLWVQKVSKTSSKVLVSDYCYNCFFSGKQKFKTLIAFPDRVGEQGIITIDKPLDQVEILDIIKVYKKIKCD